MKHLIGTLTEPKAQRWRALAVLDDGTEALLCLGQTVAQVRETYQLAWRSVFPPEVRTNVLEVVLQKWVGTPDFGSWQIQTPLPLPQESQVA